MYGLFLTAIIPSQALDLGENNISALVIDEEEAQEAAHDVSRRRHLFASKDNGTNGTFVSVFYQLSVLRKLWLDRNALTHLLPDESFHGLYKLAFIDVCFNNITLSISGGHNQSQRLLSENKSSDETTTSAFSWTPELIELYLRSNRIDSIPEGFFNNLTSLEVPLLTRFLFNFILSMCCLHVHTIWRLSFS